MRLSKSFGSTLSVAGAAGVLAAGAVLVNASPRGGAQPAPQCKISPVEAINIALKKQPGRALMANFEFDEGHWIYGVMIVHGKTITEIELDPMTGKIGNSETVTPAGEAKEVQSELTAALAGKVSKPEGAKEKK